MIDFGQGAPTTIDLDHRWRAGQPPGRHPPEPPIEVHAADEHTFTLRQSKTAHHEAPVMYLFFGSECALLLDTGATAQAERFPLRAAVNA